MKANYRGKYWLTHWLDCICLLTASLFLRILILRGKIRENLLSSKPGDVCIHSLYLRTCSWLFKNQAVNNCLPVALYKKGFAFVPLRVHLGAQVQYTCPSISGPASLVTTPKDHHTTLKDRGDLQSWLIIDRHKQNLIMLEQN